MAKNYDASWTLAEPRTLPSRLTAGEPLSATNDGGVASESGTWTRVKELGRLRHQDSVRGLAFSPDGRQFLAGGRDGIACLWDVEAGKELRRSRATRRTCLPSPSPRTGDGRRPRAGTGPCGCGTCRPARSCAASAGTSLRCIRWRSPPTVVSSYPAVADWITTRSWWAMRRACGTWRLAGRCGGSRERADASIRSPSLRTGNVPFLRVGGMTESFTRLIVSCVSGTW